MANVCKLLFPGSKVWLYVVPLSFFIFPPPVPDHTKHPQFVCVNCVYVNLFVHLLTRADAKMVSNSNLSPVFYCFLFQLIFFKHFPKLIENIKTKTLTLTL